MNRTLFTLSLGIGAMILATQHAFAQPAQNCAPRQAVIMQLANNYGEHRQSMGLSADNTVIEVFASDATGTWSITVTRPDGLTCLVAAGQAYEQAAPDKARTAGSEI